MRCRVCGVTEIKKSGTIEKVFMTRLGKRKRRIQAYRCLNGHYFQKNTDTAWDDSFIELVVFVYLQCLSLNVTINIIRGIYEEEILTKGQVLEMIQEVADTLPTLDDIDRLFNPKRSGYLAFDGVWFEYEKQQIVLYHSQMNLLEYNSL